MSQGSGRRVAVSGARGFIGEALLRAMRADGWTVHPLVRGKAGEGEIEWSPHEGRIDRAALEGVDAVVHLAGESVFGLWTDAKKRRIVESRARGTRLLAEAIAGLNAPPRILVSASGVGYYGDAGDAVLTEEAPRGDDFLADVCAAWEAGADPAREGGVRVVHTRFGLVLDDAGGALGLMLPAFRLGLGAALGSGRQWMSWVTRADAVRAIRFAIDAESLRGPANVAAPEPVRNETFTRAVADLLHRPAFLSVPGWALRTFSGGMGEALLLASQRAVPASLTAAGFEFLHPDIRVGLAATLDGSDG